MNLPSRKRDLHDIMGVIVIAVGGGRGVPPPLASFASAADGLPESKKQAIVMLGSSDMQCTQAAWERESSYEN